MFGVIPSPAGIAFRFYFCLREGHLIHLSEWEQSDTADTDSLIQRLNKLRKHIFGRCLIKIYIYFNNVFSSFEEIKIIENHILLFWYLLNDLIIFMCISLSWTFLCRITHGGNTLIIKEILIFVGYACLPP